MYMYIRIACYNISPKLLAGTVTRTIRGGLLSLIPMHSERDRNRERESERQIERERENVLILILITILILEY